jgi:hypothetical protein
MRYLLVLGLLLSTTASAETTIKRFGSSCQICIENGAVKVCKFHKRCPIKEKKGE